MRTFVVLCVIEGSRTAWFEGTDGYACTWPVVGLPIRAAIPIVSPLTRAEEKRRDG